MPEILTNVYSVNAKSDSMGGSCKIIQENNNKVCELMVLMLLISLYRSYHTRV